MTRLGFGFLFVLLAIPTFSDHVLYQSIADELVSESIVSAARGDSESARVLLERAVEIEPAHGDANWLLAQTELAQQSATTEVLSRLATALEAERLVRVDRETVRLAYSRLLLQIGRYSEVFALFNNQRSLSLPEQEVRLEAQLETQNPWEATLALRDFRASNERLVPDLLYFGRQTEPSLELLVWLSNNPSDDASYLDILRHAVALYGGKERIALAERYYHLGGDAGEPAARVLAETGDTETWLPKIRSNEILRAETAEILLSMENADVDDVLRDKLSDAQILFDSNSDGRSEGRLGMAGGAPRFWQTDIDSDGIPEVAVFRADTVFLAAFGDEGITALRYDPYPFVREVVDGTSDNLRVRTLRETRVAEFRSIEELLAVTDGDLRAWISTTPASVPIDDVFDGIVQFESPEGGVLVFTRTDPDFVAFLAENDL